ncbi:MAG TPA: hypothetical protein VGA94_05610 [Thermodesulfobacteriota bacterium]|jgi:hypothetical protein
MKNKLLRALIILAIFLNINLAYAVPPPCSEEELLKTSDYAIEGFVTKVECERAQDSKECTPFPESKEFKPELVSNCIAGVEVTESLKGNHSAGDKVQIPFLKVVQVCQNGEQMIPGSAKKHFNLNSKIRYYNSASCEYWNLEEIEKPTLKPELEKPN